MNTTYSKRRKIAIPKRQKEEFFSHRHLQREECAIAWVQGGEHGCGGVLFALHLGMAIGTFQKARVTMTGQFCHGLLVDAAVQQSGDEEVTQGVEVIFCGETVGGVDLTQTLGECVGVEQLSLLVDEQIWAEISAPFGGFLYQPPAVTEQNAAQSRGEDDLAAAAVFGGAFHDALAGHDAAGTADGEKEAVTAAAEVRPAQSTQLTSSHSCGHGQQIEHPEMPRLF